MEPGIYNQVPELATCVVERGHDNKFIALFHRSLISEINDIYRIELDYLLM